MFRAIYEVFGLNPFFSSNMAQFLAGAEDLCGERYSGVPLYTFYGIIMVLSTAFFYAMKYHLLFDKSKYSSRGWWWIFAGLTTVFNFIFVAIALWKKLSTAVVSFECDEEFINIISNMQEIGMVAIVIAVSSFLLFTLLSWPPVLRLFSKNCRNQKPF